MSWRRNNSFWTKLCEYLSPACIRKPLDVSNKSLSCSILHLDKYSEVVSNIQLHRFDEMPSGKPDRELQKHSFHHWCGYFP